ncbi:hypothetical protein [Rhizobium sp. 007]|uniref:hypothetical protein n=1 Tax=Rhizobium sp. 007 TaxID=2785056 RepID=UPI001FEF1CA8|nr:hypothetical protein [Rhizobium sp. 007]
MIRLSCHAANDLRLQRVRGRPAKRASFIALSARMSIVRSNAVSFLFVAQPLRQSEWLTFGALVLVDIGSPSGYLQQSCSDDQIMDRLLLNEVLSSLLMEQVKKTFELLVSRRLLPSDCIRQLDSLLDGRRSTC